MVTRERAARARRLAVRLAALALAAGPAAAQDAVVPDAFATIQSAVLDATDADGDGTVEIFVRAGVYHEDVWIARSGLSIDGESAATTHVIGSGLSDVVRIEGVARVDLRELTVTSRGLANGIAVRRSSDCRIEGHVSTANRDGISVEDSLRIVLGRNACAANSGAGIRVRRTSGVLVVRNDCEGNGAAGVDLRRSGTSLVLGNTARWNALDGLRLDWIGASRIEDNACYENAGNGLAIEVGIGNRIARNVCASNAASGLRTRATLANEITQNRFVENGAWGVERRDATEDDWDAARAGAQDPPGDNDLAGNAAGPLHEG